MRFLYSFLFSLVASVVAAQPLPYEFSILNEDYIPFEDGTSLTDGFEWDDEYFSAPIGFSFTYMDSTYEMISGLGIFGGLGSELILGEFSEVGKYDIMCPALVDMVDAPGKEESDISYITIGEPGSRIFKLQWANCSVYGEDGPTNARIELQVWLYEATNSIDFRYGITSDFIAQDYFLINGLPIYLGKDCFVDGDPGLPTNIWAMEGSAGSADIQSFQTLNEFFTGIFLEDYPTQGLVYHFEGVPDHIESMESAVLTAYPTITDHSVALSGFAPGASLRVFDAMGNLVYQDKLSSTRYNLDVVTWPAGMYIVEVHSEQTQLTARIIRR